MLSFWCVCLDRPVTTVLDGFVLVESSLVWVLVHVRKTEMVAVVSSSSVFSMVTGGWAMRRRTIRLSQAVVYEQKMHFCKHND